MHSQAYSLSSARYTSDPGTEAKLVPSCIAVYAIARPKAVFIEYAETIVSKGEKT